MAGPLPFEAMQDAERTTARDERRRMVESWATEESFGRFCKFSGQSLEAIRLTLEDTIIEVAAINPANAAEIELAKVRMLNRLRESHGTVCEAFKRSRVGAKHGAETMEKLFDTAGADADLTDEEKKALKSILKDKEKDSGGKWPREKTAAGKGNWKPGGSGWSGPGNSGGGQGPWNQGSGFTMGGGGNSWGNNNWGNQGGGQNQQIAGPAAQSGQPIQGLRPTYRDQQRARFPCDNCGQMGHWRSEIICPNYHIYLATQQVASAAYQSNRQGGQRAIDNTGFQAGANSGAVVPYKGMKHIVGSEFNNFNQSFPTINQAFG